MSASSPGAPVHIARIDRLRAAVWENQDDQGRFAFSVSLSRSYRLPPERRGSDDDGWRDTNSLRETDLLDAALLLQHARQWIAVHKQQPREDARQPTMASDD